MNIAAALDDIGVEHGALLRELEGEQTRRLMRNRLAHYKPYAKQAEFHAMGAFKRERLFLAGNQLGKTSGGGYETAMHLTGRYPDWWKGRRFNHPTAGWVGGVTAEATRDGAQRILLGRSGEKEEGVMGTGTIPADCILGQPPSRPGTAGAYAMIKVRHVTGGVSIATLKSYDQGRTKWQSDTLDFVWFDEEPPEDIYTEGIARTNAGDEGRTGIGYMTFTPLEGMSIVVCRFMLEDSPDRGYVTMTIDDVDHYTPEQKAMIIASYPVHEREARARGVPVLGSGAVFPVEEESITWDLVRLPRHVKRIVALDFGWDHPTAAVWLSWDPDPDIVYVTDAYRVSRQSVVIHAAAIKARSGNRPLPVAWPHDGFQHDKGSGYELADQYRAQGLEMLEEHAQFDDDRGNGVEAGASEMLMRMETGRWKVARHLTEWFQEFRLYHRKDGKIVKEFDDLLAASRYGLMMLRFARAPKPPAASFGSRPGQNWKTA